MYNYVYKSENGGQNERDSQSKNERADLVYDGGVEDIIGHADHVAAVVA